MAYLIILFICLCFCIARLAVSDDAALKYKSILNTYYDIEASRCDCIFHAEWPEQPADITVQWAVDECAYHRYMRETLKRIPPPAPFDRCPHCEDFTCPGRVGYACHKVRYDQENSPVKKDKLN